MDAPLSPRRVLIPVGLGTSLSLIGDTALYTVLPTHAADAGVALASLGILLSANRWIRLLLNGPAGVAYDRRPRRFLFVPALFIGALSTALYATPYGFWPLFLGRILWGIAWVGIWIGGNTIILDVATQTNRGRWVGYYHMTFFFGAAAGALLGGLLTDLFGYSQAMIVAASLTLFGAFVALVFLPETRHLHQTTSSAADEEIVEDDPLVKHPDPQTTGSQLKDRSFLAALLLLGTNRLVIAGLLLSTLGLYLAGELGDSASLGRFTLGVASLTGIMLSINALVSMVSAPAFGSLSDRLGNRWRTAAVGLLPGITGFAFLGIASPLLAMLGVPLAAVTSGSSQSLSITLVEEAGSPQYRSRRLGILFTTGDLGSAIGPLLAFALIPLVGIRNLYLLAAILLAVMFLIAWYQSTRDSQDRAVV